MLIFDESNIVERLNRVPPTLRAAFAATCAERLFPSYVAFSKKTASGNPQVLRSSLNQIWRALETKDFDEKEMKSRLEHCMELIPEDEQEDWIIDRVYAESATSAIAYALRALLTQSSQEAAWASRCAYEAIDYYVTNSLDADWNRPGAEEEILSAPVMQQELSRQREDLNDLVEGCTEGFQSRKLMTVLRERSLRESLHFFDIG